MIDHRCGEGTMAWPWIAAIAALIVCFILEVFASGTRRLRAGPILMPEPRRRASRRRDATTRNQELVMQQRRPVMLVVLDGWGWREERADNAVRQARTPAFDRLWSGCPHALMRTSGADVGLPPG